MCVCMVNLNVYMGGVCKVCVHGRCVCMVKVCVCIVKVCIYMGGVCMVN